MNWLILPRNCSSSKPQICLTNSVFPTGFARIQIYTNFTGGGGDNAEIATSGNVNNFQNILAL